MNILFLNHNVKGIGTYIRCFHFAKHLSRFGHNVAILTSAPNYILFKRKVIVDGVEVIYMPDFLPRRYRNGGLGLIDTFLRCIFILKRNFDIVENYDHRPAVLYPALVSKYFRKIPLVSEWTDLHGTGGSLSNRPKKVQKLIRPYEDFTEKKSKKLPERLIVISRELKKIAIELGIPSKNIQYIPGGSDIDNITSKSKMESRKLFKLPFNKKIIAYTAGTHYDKDLFLKTINKIQKNRQDVLLITTGDILGEDFKNRLYDSRRIIEFGFLGYSKYTALLPAADIFIFPFSDVKMNRSRWPNKVGDYMAAGRPTVSNRTGDLIQLFEKHKIGILALSDYNDFAAKALYLLSEEELCNELGKNARLTAEKYYDWAILAKELEKCFFEVTKYYEK